MQKYGDQIADDTLPGHTPPSVRNRYEIKMEAMRRELEDGVTSPDSDCHESNSGETIASERHTPPTPVSCTSNKSSNNTPVTSWKSSSPSEQVDITIKTRPAEKDGSEDIARFGAQDKTQPEDEDTSRLGDTAQLEDETGQVDFWSIFPVHMPKEDIASTRNVCGDITRCISALAGQAAATGCSLSRRKRKWSVAKLSKEKQSCFTSNVAIGRHNNLKGQIAATECTPRGLKRQFTQDERDEEVQLHLAGNATSGEWNAPLHNQRAKRR